MPQAVNRSGIAVYGQVKVERGGELLYQSPPEKVKVTSLLHHLYEQRRVRYCFLTPGQAIPDYYRTGELPPRRILAELLLLEIKISIRRVKKWLKEHHLPTFSM